MKILALDTSRKISSATFLDTATGRSVTRSCAEKNNESLLLTIQAVLKEGGNELSDMDALGVCTGPGSFTGLRIGITTMKSFAQMLNRPVYGMRSLDAMEDFTERAAVPVLDARGGRVYRKDPETGESVLTAASELPKESHYSSFPSEQLAAILAGHRVHWLPDDAPLSRAVAVHAAKQLAAKAPGDWRRLLPDYVGVSQAERERETKRCRD